MFFCFFSLQSEPSRHFGCADLQKLEVFYAFFRPSILVCGEYCIFLLENLKNSMFFALLLRF